MLQETTAAPAAGAGNAQALTQMGFANLIEHMTVVNWIVFIVLMLTLPFMADSLNSFMVTLSEWIIRG